MEPKAVSELLQEVAGNINQEVSRLLAIKDNGQGSREQSIAITNLEQGIMWLDRAADIQRGLEGVANFPTYEA